MTTLISNGGGPSKRRKRERRSGLIEPNEEELELAESLFGAGSQALKKAKQSGRVSNEPIGNGDEDGAAIDDEADDQEHEIGDDELFMLDTSIGEGPEKSVSRLIGSTGNSDESAEEEDVGDVTQSSTSKSQRRSKSSREKRQPVWTDPSSDTLTITLTGADAGAQVGSRSGRGRLRKLRETEDEVTVSGTEYERRLRTMFEKLHPLPRWATAEARKASGMASIGDLLSSDIGLVSRVTGDARKHGKHALPAQRLDLQRLRNANEQQGRSDLPSIETISFHPSTRAHVMLTTAKDKRLRLFNVDGKDNALLETIHVPELPLANAQFHPSGSSVLLSGPRPFLFVHDLYTGKTTKSTPWRAFGGSDDEASQERDFTRASFAPSTSSDSASSGRLLALGGRRGVIYLMDWGAGAGGGSTAGGSLVGSVRMNAPLAGMCWDPVEQQRLVTLSTEGTLHTWDTRQMRCELQRTDAGLFAPSSLQVTPDGQWWAVGSDNGIVNTYGRQAVEGSRSNATAGLQPHKSFGNLVTATTSMSFNDTGEILAYASSKKVDALKVVHLPSFSVFENWPTAQTPLGRITALNFSSDSKYLAMGNHRGKVLLYSLQHYSR